MSSASLRPVRLLIFLFIVISAALAHSEVFDIPPFGAVTVYNPPKAPTGVILLASGIDGWKGPVTEIAQSLVGESHLVVGFDINEYFRGVTVPGVTGRREICPAANFEMLGKEVQRKMNLPDFLFPVLLGYAEGGTLVFVAEAEAPTNFLGAVSLGFCPTLPISGPLCPGWGFHSKPGNDGKSETILPTLDLRYPWVVLEGTGATSCQPEAFVKRVPRGIYVEADAKNATSQVNFQVNQLLQTMHAPAANTGLADLPIFELNGNGNADSMLILISGDGGWVSLDREIGNYLFGKGASVIGFDSLRYFWKGKTPQEAARDIKRIMAYYLPAWHKKKVILVGYSMGADVLPFIVKRMHPRDLKEVSAVALIGPSSKADFQTGPLMADEEPGKAKQIFPALRNLTDLRLVCIGGSLERPPSLCERLQEDKKMSKEIEIQFLPSGHMFQMNPIPISDLLNQKFHLY